jgi:hypothetical protein
MKMKGTLKLERLSLRELCEGKLEGSWFTLDPGGCVKVGLGDWHLSIGDPLGNLEGGSDTGDFEK